MEAIEIVSPHMVGADLAAGASPVPDVRGGWALPGQAAHSAAEHHALAASLGAAGDLHSHAVRHRRISAQTTHAHSPGIPIRPARPRGRGAHVDPVEFAEYAVAHMRPSPRFTPMGHGYPLSSSMTSDARASLPRSFRSPLHPPLHLPRQHTLDELRPDHPDRPSPGADAA
ncbi:hypothetical protein H4R19_005283 [Coemansia spiralis]|nr:hypothetical protein H4R19_005283 [Coemansia spiralis]